MTATNDSFFKPDKHEDDLASYRAPGALDIIEAEVAARAERAKRLREVRLQLAFSNSHTQYPTEGSASRYSYEFMP